VKRAFQKEAFFLKIESVSTFAPFPHGIQEGQNAG